MKKIGLLIVSLLFLTVGHAQFKQLAEGPVFKEPTTGFAKILQMKNGNTVFVHMSEDDAIAVRVYNPAREEVNALNSPFTKIRNIEKSAIEGVFEINGNIVIFVSKIESRTPTLYRVLIDGATGSLKEEIKIAQLNRMALFAGYALAFGGVPMPDFYIRKDPNSDTYAIAMFNSFESDRSKRIEIVVYGADNQELRRAYYASPEEKYKYLVYLDMALISPDMVSVLAYGYNTNHSGGKASELILANLEKGATSVNFTELNFSKDLFVPSGLVRYNPVMKCLVLVANTQTAETRKSRYYVPYLALVDPFEKKLLGADPMHPSDNLIHRYKDPFDGSPQNLFVNDDGTFTVVMEQLAVTIMSSQYSTTYRTDFGNIAVENYDKTGRLVSDYLIPKSQRASNLALGSFYLSRREGTAQLLFEGHQFKSFAYINGKSKGYILFNDTERNNEHQQDGDLVTVSGVSSTDGFFYQLTGTDVIPKRELVFGQPEKKRDHNLGLFSISDYDQKNNVYAVLKLENESGKKGVKVVWLQP
jgi:hypothetical protein